MGRANYWPKIPNTFSGGVNNRSQIHNKFSGRANYRSKNHADWNNRRREIKTKNQWHIVSNEIASKSHEKPGNLSKITCITFAQYCTTPVHVNSTFLVHWLASSEMIGQVLFTSQQRKKNKMAFVCTLSQIMLLFGPLVIQLIHLSVGESGVYLPSLWWIIVKYSPCWRLITKLVIFAIATLASKQI